MTTATDIRPAVAPPLETAASEAQLRSPPKSPARAGPVVVAVDDSSAAESAIRDGVRVASDLDAPIVFVYVRRGPWAGLGDPYHQRRLDVEMRIGERAIAAGIAAARRAGVPASGEQLHGRPAPRLAFVMMRNRRRRRPRSTYRR